MKGRTQTVASHCCAQRTANNRVIGSVLRKMSWITKRAIRALVLMCHFAIPALYSSRSATGGALVEGFQRCSLLCFSVECGPSCGIQE